MSETAAPDPRRRDSARTKAAILAAAQAAFSSRGYAQTGIREIAALAGINSTLVARYFGSKEALFEAALRDALDIESLLVGGRRGFGASVAALLSRPDPGVDPLSMMILATADEAAKAVALRLLETLVIEELADWIGPPDAQARAAQISILCSGFVTYSRLLPIDALSPERAAVATAWLERSLQAVIDAA
jgi:AcrR family transcriptional regulator